MKKLQLTFVFALFCLVSKSFGQMIVAPGDTLFGNEWIDYQKPYLKILVAEDGIWRISGQTMADAGWPIASISGNQFQLFHLGKEKPIRVSTDGPFAEAEFFEFFGERNRASIDAFLFKNPETTLLNPEYSLFNDTSAYFLTYSATATGIRFQEISNDLTGTLPTPEPFVWAENTVFYSDSYAKERLGEKLTHSYFRNEGWATAFAKSIEKTIAAPKLAAAATENMTLRLRYTNDLAQHFQEFSINGQVVETVASDGFKTWEKTFSTPISSVSSGVLTFKMRDTISAPCCGYADFAKAALAVATLRFPRLLDFENANSATFSLKSDSEKLLEIKAFDAATGGGDAVFFDLKNGQRLVGKVENGIVRAVFPAAQNERFLWLINSATAIKTVQKVKPVQFIDYNNSNSDFVIIANKNLAKDNLIQIDILQEYLDYRTSFVGGSHTAQLFDVENLYDQFAYGISRHPISIRNFGHFALKNWTKKPEFVLFVGKPWDHRAVRTNAQFLTTLDHFFYLPSFGTPIADQLFFADQPGDKVISKLKVGRLAAISATEVKTYLEKLKAHELFQQTAPQTLADRDWTKQVLQLSGGDPTIQDAIRGYMREFEQNIEPTKFGGEVSTFTKNAAVPIQTSVGAAVEERIRKGTAIYNVFGHSSSFGFDFYLDNPEDYDNAGRLPLMIGFGCFSGNCAANTINSSFRSIGERMTLTSPNGAIGYWATSGFGYLDQLRDFGNVFFNKACDQNFGQSVQLAFNETAKQMSIFQNDGLDALLQQLVFQGDPALRLSVAEEPDYLIDLAKVKVEPMAISIEKDSFDLEFEIVNLGRNLRDSVFFKIDLNGQNGASTTLKTGFVVADRYRTLVKTRLATPDGDPQKWLGLARLLIQLDDVQKIAEWPAPAAEANNDLIGSDGQKGVPIFFFSNDVLPIAPPDFGIFSKNEIRLTASTLNLLEPNQRIFWQIDTSAKFNSPLFQQFETTSAGGILEWKPTITAFDSTVYFWRISRDTLAGIGFVWRKSSFIVLKNQPFDGWNQSVFHQMDENDFEKMEAVDSTRQLEMEPFIYEMRFRIGQKEATAPIFWWQQQNIVNNFTNTGGFNPSYGDVLCLTIDPIAGKIVNGKKPNGRAYDNYTTYVVFRVETEVQRRAMFDYLRDSVPDGHYAALLTTQDTLKNDWNPELFGADSTAWGGESVLHLLENFGAKSLRSIAMDSVPRPWAFVFQKNRPKFKVVEMVGSLPVGPDFFVPIQFRQASGGLKTSKIGPASKWLKLETRLEMFDSQTETGRFDLIGIRANGSETVLKTMLAAGDSSLADVSATEFPFLKIGWKNDDLEKRTATQIERMRVIFESLPEGSIDPSAGLVFEKDSVEQGQPIRIAASFRHLDGPAMDSVLVKMTATTAQNQAFSFEKRLKTLAVGDSIHITATLDSKPMAGPMTFFLDVNPDNDQPERLHFNNVWTRNFYVEKDETNPILDVTFDGERLIDGDLVSPKPEIFISIKDENHFLAMTDPRTLTVKIIEPDSTERLFALDGSDATAEFFPADGADLGKKNEAKARIRPVFTKDGVYELSVSGRDAAGNESGLLDYRSRFEVITRSAISSILNYPNPFSTSTCFVYTMTGSEPPRHFRIQIMTISGKIVREIDENEFGPLKTGRHVSDFCWDGRDAFGDQLANGVYLYRILTAKADGSAFEKFEIEKADAFFDSNGWGKMVLIR